LYQIQIAGRKFGASKSASSPSAKSLAPINTPNPDIRQICNWCVFGVFLHQNTRFMKRQSITFTEPNDEWLKSQIDNKEYSSKSELVNDLIRQARSQQKQIDLIRLKLDRAEESGFTTDSKAEILKQSKKLLNG
jgi:antitoxin ParD1/3/4